MGRAHRGDPEYDVVRGIADSTPYMPPPAPWPRSCGRAWLSNIKSRRAKLTPDKLAVLAELGLHWS
ncbi:hypothetical protein [Streptomyces sp. 7N604]|uniref:hypothetical protein n=1 Tax=Streptomyces sp. 7N604 TaxID=3457415 RepID=UPI003FD44CA6